MRFLVVFSGWTVLFAAGCPLPADDGKDFTCQVTAQCMRGYACAEGVCRRTCQQPGDCDAQHPACVAGHCVVAPPASSGVASSFGGSSGAASGGTSGTASGDSASSGESSGGSSSRVGSSNMGSSRMGSSSRGGSGPTAPLDLVTVPGTAARTSNARYRMDVNVGSPVVSPQSGNSTHRLQTGVLGTAVVP
jgi:hypothetical protein